MNILTITTEHETHENTDYDGTVIGHTSWFTYFMPEAPGAPVEPWFYSEAWCNLQDHYGLSSIQADTLLGIAQDFGRADLAY